MLVGLFFAVMLASGCSKNNNSENVEKISAVTVKGVTIENISTVAMPEFMDVVGTVRASTSAVVSSRIPGTIAVLKVREGDRVKKGQLLVQLYAPENEATAAVALAAIDEAERNLNEAQSRKILADKTFDRYKNLLNAQVVSHQEFDVKQSEKDIAKQGVAQAESRLKQAQSAAKASSAISDYTKIVAPISGIISIKQVDLGASVFPGQPLLTIEDEGSYQLQLSLPENMANKIKVGTNIQVSLDAVPLPFSSRISEIVPTTDPASRTFIVKINLIQKALKSGMFGRGKIPMGTSVNGITVPKSAIIERGALTSVWTVDKENLAHLRIVKTGIQQSDRVEILSGLSENDRIITSQIGKITEAAKVE